MPNHIMKETETALNTTNTGIHLIGLLRSTTNQTVIVKILFTFMNAHIALNNVLENQSDHYTLQ